ncbi:hypothetical protein J3F84DRAFT_371349 [Trichoderma pleuroticola]
MEKREPKVARVARHFMAYTRRTPPSRQAPDLFALVLRLCLCLCSLSSPPCRGDALTGQLALGESESPRNRGCCPRVTLAGPHSVMLISSHCVLCLLRSLALWCLESYPAAFWRSRFRRAIVRGLRSFLGEPPNSCMKGKQIVCVLPLPTPNSDPPRRLHTYDTPCPRTRILCRSGTDSQIQIICIGSLPLLLACFLLPGSSTHAVPSSQSSLTLAEFDDRPPSADSLAARPFDKSGVGLDATRLLARYSSADVLLSLGLRLELTVFFLFLFFFSFCPILSHDDIAGCRPV